MTTNVPAKGVLPTDMNTFGVCTQADNAEPRLYIYCAPGGVPVPGEVSGRVRIMGFHNPLMRMFLTDFIGRAEDRPGFPGTYNRFGEIRVWHHDNHNTKTYRFGYDGASGPPADNSTFIEGTGSVVIAGAGSAAVDVDFGSAVATLGDGTTIEALNTLLKTGEHLSYKWDVDAHVSTDTGGSLSSVEVGMYRGDNTTQTVRTFDVREAFSGTTDAHPRLSYFQDDSTGDHVRLEVGYTASVACTLTYTVRVNVMKTNQYAFI